LKLLNCRPVLIKEEKKNLF